MWEFSKMIHVGTYIINENISHVVFSFNQQSLFIQSPSTSTSSVFIFLTIIKNKEITLLTKVHIVKAMVFPVVMYEYKS